MADKKEYRVLMNDDVTLIVTAEGAKLGYHKQGDEYVVHSVQADKIVAKGFAEYKDKADRGRAMNEKNLLKGRNEVNV